MCKTLNQDRPGDAPGVHGIAVRSISLGVESMCMVTVYERYSGGIGWYKDGVKTSWESKSLL